MGEVCLFVINADKDANRTRGLRTTLISVVVITLALIVILVGLAMWNASNSFRSLSTALLENSTKSIAMSIEGEINTRVALLETLASPNLPRRTSNDLIIRFNQVRSADRPHLAVLDGVAAQRALSRYNIPPPHDGAVLSDVHFPAGSLQPEIAIAVRSPGTSGITIMTMPPGRLIQGLSIADQGKDALLFAVTDSKGRIIARSRNPQKYVGKKTPDWEKLLAVRRANGTFMAKTAEGAPIIFAFRKLAHTPGWMVVAGEPLARFNARWQTPANIVLTALALAAILALLAVLGLSRIILKPVEMLAAHSQRVARGENARASDLKLVTSIKEFETLRQSLDDAEQTLRERASTVKEAMEVLSVSEHRYRALAQVGTLVSFEADAEGKVIAVSGWEALTGVPDADAPERWWDNIHADDRQSLQIEIDHAASSPPRMGGVEFRVRTVRDEWQWVRARATPIHTASGALAEWVGVLEDVDERRRAQERIWHLAHHDALTGLCNRTYLEERLPELMMQATLANTGLAVHLFDVDKFKEVNDTGGHSAGDALLIAIASAIRDVANDYLAARIGGDEFVIVQPDVKHPADAEQFAERLLTRLRLTPSSNATSGFVNASLGYARYPRDGHTAKLLIRNADIALYEAKKLGRGEACCFTDKMARAIQERRMLEKELFRAVTTRTDEISVVYQPQFRTRDRQLIGYEALARWTHPIRGAIPPKTFIPIAEESGMITRLGTLLLREACKEATRWPSDMLLAANLSAMQIMQADLPEKVHAILLETGLSPKRLEFEITEGVLIRDRDLALHVLRRLKAMGIRIALDDFGTGYSSLEYLHTFPFDKVKIDQSFTRDLSRDSYAGAIIRSITSLGKTLHFEVLAEGVEQEEQLTLLADYECEFVQGYLLGAPAKASPAGPPGTPSQPDGEARTALSIR